FALELYMGGAEEVGAQFRGEFDRTTLAMPRVGFRYQSHTWMFSLQGGGGSREAYQMGFARANFDWRIDRKWRLQLSAIQRHLTFDGFSNVTLPQFKVEGNSSTAAGYLYMRFMNRYKAGAYLGVEHVTLEGHDATSSEPQKSSVYPKGGAMVSLSF